ncbi:MAG: 4Fe-4S dicluster domain-containing protein [Candidatus Bathyarchaeota archaeon]|nr:4Fe-4S dicluster domain-containing protein [Candidatus Bathyarchaeota archaeon]MDH5623328.1 4Fe-4S dicluster domain-containing protein [Candidatus Bathyarchaeota archaeon]MDH5635077.1 4Fe-4S dicluster domain-containing protein [Candidatus Bathyarchaeota archaeon]
MEHAHPHAHILEKEKFAEFINALEAEGEVIAPKSNGFDLFYVPIENASEIDLSKIPLDCPKNYVFPITEKILEVKDERIIPIVESRKRVLFGIRPCDVAAFQCQKEFFEDYVKEGKIRDPYVMDKIDKLTIVAYNCPEPKEHCFCVAMGTGPVTESGFDLALTDLGDVYLVEPGNSKGEEIIQKLSLPTASFEDMERKEEIKKQCIEKMNVSFDAQGIEKIIHKKIDAVAEKHGKKCIVCGGCNFFCPTCSCFNMSDTVSGGVIRREKFWDSCLLRGFTWLAGVGFERDTMDSRMKQRIMHKLSYTKEHYNLYSCTGCGRCSQVCPSFIFMEDMIKDILGGK